MLGGNLDYKFTGAQINDALVLQTQTSENKCGLKTQNAYPLHRETGSYTDILLTIFQFYSLELNRPKKQLLK